MASKILNLAIILSLFLALHSQISLSLDLEDEEEEEEYILDAPFANTRLRSRFLASIKKGKQCHPKTKNICHGIRANKGTSLLYCCKTHCRNVLSDRNHCGRCGNKCKLNQRCCNGRCTDVFFNKSHCGKCNKKCSKGVKCGYGYCGYA